MFLQAIDEQTINTGKGFVYKVKAKLMSMTVECAVDSVVKVHYEFTLLAKPVIYQSIEEAMKETQDGHN